MRWLLLSAYCAVVVFGQCDQGWTYDGKGKCVKVAGSASWGPDTCEKLKSGAILATLENPKVQQSLGSFIGNVGKVWTGLNTLVPLRSAWRWVDGMPYIWSGSTNAMVPSFDLWAPFKPTPTGGECAYIGGSSCDYPTASLCEKDCSTVLYSLCAYNPKTKPCRSDWTANKQAFLCLKVTPTKQAFGDDPCKQLEPTASLVSILSSDEASFIKANIPLVDETWVGLTRQNPDPPKWEWADGTVAIQYANMWDTGRPNGAGSCAYIAGTAETECKPGTGALCDGACSLQLPHLCEYDYQGPPVTIQAPANAPVQPPQAQAPVQAPMQANAPVQPPQAQAPVQAPMQAVVPVAAPPTAQAPVGVPAAQTPVQTPSNLQAPGQVPVQAPEVPEAPDAARVPDAGPVSAPADSSGGMAPGVVALLVIIGLLVCCVLGLLYYVKVKRGKHAKEHASVNAEMEEALVVMEDGAGGEHDAESTSSVPDTHTTSKKGSLSGKGHPLCDASTLKGSAKPTDNTVVESAGMLHPTAEGTGDAQGYAGAAGQGGLVQETPVVRDASNVVGSEGALDAVGGGEVAWWMLENHVYKKNEMVKVRDKEGGWQIGAVVHARGKGINAVVKAELSDGTTKVWYETQPTGSGVLVRDREADSYLRGTLAPEYGLFFARTETGTYRWLDIIPDLEARDEATVEFQYGESVKARMHGGPWYCGIVMESVGGKPQVSVPGVECTQWDEVVLDDGEDASMGTEPDDDDLAGRRDI